MTDPGTDFELPPRGRPRLEGKVAIVTGAGSRAPGIGNGRATAILFAREGARVVAVDRDLEAASLTVDLVKEHGGEAEALQADVTAGEDCAAMVRAALNRWGRLDILHNNVGISGRGSVVDASLDEWEAVQRTNVTGMVLSSRHAIPAMVEGGGGSVVNVSSISALRPRGLTAYSVSKGAVIALTQAMAVDHAPQGVRVNCIAPGPVYTPMVAGRGMTEEQRERRRQASPLKIEGTAWDIAYAALYLASDEARYVTGVVLPVDGGTILVGPERSFG